jgi:hypothetical protein
MKQMYVVLAAQGHRMTVQFIDLAQPQSACNAATTLIWGGSLADLILADTAALR